MKILITAFEAFGKSPIIWGVKRSVLFMIRVERA